MVLRAVAVLALTVSSSLAFGAAAGELSGQQAQTSVHVVTAGETLSVIANQYLGSASEWRRIWEANRASVVNLDAIEPGQSLVIPTPEEPIPSSAGLSDVSVQTAGAPPQAARPSAQPSGPAGAPRPGDRTVFFQDPSAGPLQGGVIGSQTTTWLAVPPHIFYSAGWLERADVEPFHVGRIGGFAGGENPRGRRDTAHGYETLSLVMSAEHHLAVGDELVTFRVGRDEEELGFVSVPTGMVTVQRTNGATAVLVVTEEFDRVRLGDYVAPAAEYTMQRGTFPVDVADSVSATVIAFQDEQQSLQGPGDVAFLNKGAEDGLAVGDEFVASVAQDGSWSGMVVGRLQVVRLQTSTAAARIVEMDTPIWTEGMAVRLARKMP